MRDARLRRLQGDGRGARGARSGQIRWMPELVLILRYVGETEATVWVETAEPCTVGVLGRTARTFRVEGHDYALVVLRGARARGRPPLTRFI